jgi:hypothetical protein
MISRITVIAQDLLEDDSGVVTELNADLAKGVLRLTALVDLQEKLLACYRLNKRPSEALLTNLYKAREELGA